MSFIDELKRRNVLRASAAYLALGWVVIQVTSTMVPALNLPPAVVPIVTWIGVIGFPFLVMFAWIYELTPEGLKREREIDRSDSITHVTAKRLDYAVIVLLVLAIGFFAFDRIRPRSRVVEAAPVAATPQATAVAAPGAPAVADHSIAVLPFVNMSDDKGNEYFSDGISEELLNLLAKIPALQVAARTSSFSFKGKDVEIAEIARLLRVAHVLEGSVRKSGDKVRITAQLIRADSGYHLWSQTWDRTLDDIFAIQDEIAADVVKQLQVTLLGKAPTVRKTDPQAYALYLQAVQLFRQGTAEAYQQSDALYQQALAIDPRYAPAWNGLSRNSIYEASAGVLSNEEGFRRAREAVDKALAIDPDYAPAHAQLGRLAFEQGDLASGARQLDRALALDPADLEVLGRATRLLQGLGRQTEAIAIQEFVAARDPVNTSAIHSLGLYYQNAGRYDESIEQTRTVLSLAPGRTAVRLLIGVSLLRKGEPEAALTEMQAETSEMWRMIGLPMALHALGRKAEADAALAQLIARFEKDAPYNIAYVHAFRGDADGAFEWLAKAVQYADPGLADIPTESLFDNLRKDPRWLPFLRTIGKAPEQLAQIPFKVTLPDQSAAR